MHLNKYTIFLFLHPNSEIGNPTEVAPPEILDYDNSEVLKSFMYNDTSDGSLVLYIYPYWQTELTKKEVKMNGKFQLSEELKGNEGKILGAKF